MLYRKIEKTIEDYLKSDSDRILIVDGARQVGKTYSISHVGRRLFKNYIEINFVEDSLGRKLFENVAATEDFYLAVSMLAGDRMKDKENTLIFLDEIQVYPKLLTLLKFLKKEDRFTYIASGSLLGVTLMETTSIPIGSIETIRMYPLDFEEWLYANDIGTAFVESMKEKFLHEESLDENTHSHMMNLFKKYLLVGGMPDAVNAYIAEKNIDTVRKVQEQIHQYYAIDASKYDEERKLKIRRIYDMIPSSLENKKKRIVVKNIEDRKGKRYSDYQDEFEYLIGAGIALEVKAISNPSFPLIESGSKNLMKLYLNDVGILTGILYKNNVQAVLDDKRSINLGTVYESAVASELAAHGHSLFYYDNRNKGEVDYLLDDYQGLKVIPLEIKSGKDYTVHSALNTFLKQDGYPVEKGYVLSNERQITRKEKAIYIPIYDIMFF
jgi:predicted AAA+ superfamily ATPase